MPLLDLSALQAVPFTGGMLKLPASAGFPVQQPEDSNATNRAIWDQIEADNRRENARADRRNAAGLAKSANVAGEPYMLPSVDASNPAITMALGQSPVAPKYVAGPTIDQNQPAPMAPGAPAPALPPAQIIAPAPAVAAPQADPTALPVNATPTEGQGNPAAIPETSLLGRLKQGLADNSNLLLSLGAGMAGAPSFGTGLSRGLQMAVPGSQLDRQIQNQNLTVQALVRRGLPPDVASAAATNPAILQQILPQVFGARQRKFTQTGEDMLGNKQFGFVDEVNGKVYDLTGKELAPGAATSGTTLPTGPDGQPLQGQDLFSHLEKTQPAIAAEVRAMIAGDANVTPRNLQKLAPLAHLVDPTFSEAAYPARMALQKSYMGGGKDFQELQALNTVGGHLGRLVNSAEALGNTGFKPWNWLKNATADMIGGSPALVRFRNDLVTTQNELAKAYHGGHVSDSAYAAFNKAINEAQTPAEMKAAIGELAGLLQSKIEAKESGYRYGMGKAPLPAEFSAINDEAKHSFQRINNWSSGFNQGSGQAIRVNSPAEAAKLPKGTRFVDPNGVERIVP